MRRFRIEFLPASFALVLAACSTAAPKVDSLRLDTYHVGVSSGPYVSQADTDRKALQTASAYCGQMGQGLLFRQSSESGAHPWSTKHEDLTFVCVDPQRLGLMQAGNRTSGAIFAQE